jgi:3-oxoadipate enol-lactonase
MESSVGWIKASDGTDIHYRVWGARDRPPLLLLQGLGCDANGWVFQRMALARHYRCIALDNRGVGKSGAPAGPYSLEQMARDAITVLDVESVACASVMGISMGGVVSQLLAIKYPQRVSSLVLAATACRHQGWRVQLLARWQYLAVHYGMAKVAPAVVPWFVGARARRLLGPTAALTVRAVLPWSARAFASQLEAILEVPDELRALHSGLTMPTSIIVGALDALTPPEDSRELAARLPHAELTIIPHVGHALIAEAPVQFNQAVLSFLLRHA